MSWNQPGREDVGRIVDSAPEDARLSLEQVLQPNRSVPLTVGPPGPALPKPGGPYDIGDEIELISTFADPETGLPVDPTTVTCKVKRPDKTEGTLTVLPVETGKFRALVVLDQSGRWYYKFFGVGAYQAASERNFMVNKPNVT